MDDGLQPDETRNRRVRVVYFGTPEYAIPTLDRLAADARFDVRLVVTQPDRPAGRRHQLTPPPVKIAAERLGLQVYQPETLRMPDARQPLVAAEAELFVVAAYGLIFGEKTLAIPSVGCVNLHASLLPRYRGASPIAAAILEGDAETGVSLMRMERGLDTGPVYGMATTSIEADETTASLTQRLANLGAELAIDRLPQIAKGAVEATPQPAEGASLTRPLTKVDGAIDWSWPADELERQVRAMWPWPRAWTMAGDQRLQIHQASFVSDSGGGEPGELSFEGDAPEVTCGVGRLRLEVVQGAGGKAMPGAAWAAGVRARLTRLEAPADVSARPSIVTQI